MFADTWVSLLFAETALVRSMKGAHQSLESKRGGAQSCPNQRNQNTGLTRQLEPLTAPSLGREENTSADLPYPNLLRSRSLREIIQREKKCGLSIQISIFRGTGGKRDLQKPEKQSWTQDSQKTQGFRPESCPFPHHCQLLRPTSTVWTLISALSFSAFSSSSTFKRAIFGLWYFLGCISNPA